MNLFRQFSFRVTVRCRVKGAAIWVMIFLVNLTVFSLRADTADYFIDLWTSDNGLPDSSVTAIAQTPDGYLWIGTYNGLARFDGVQFVNFDPFNTPALKHARVDGLFVDGQGTLWINTHDGSMTAWHNGVFTCEWQGGQVSAVFSRSNEIFFASLYGLLAYRSGNLEAHGEWQTVPLAETTTGNLFRQDGSGTIWYATREGALARMIGTNAAVVFSKNDLAGERVSCLSTDDRGRLWLGTDRRILVWSGDHFDDETPTNGEAAVKVSFIAGTATNGCWVVVDGRVRKCMARRWVAEAESWRDLSEVDTAYLAAYEDSDGGVWIRQYGRGLLHAKPDGTMLQISSADGLPGNRVSSWFQDREGNVWVGVDHGGLARLRRKTFHVIGTAEGLPIHAVSTVCEDSDNNIWIGTFGGGLNRWRDGVLKRFDLATGAYKGNFFSAYPAVQGRVWLSAGREDLFLLENEKISQPAGLIHGVKAILVDHRGQVWIGRQSGLTCLSNGVANHFNPTNGIERQDVRALAEDQQGKIWIGTGEGVLYEFADGKFTPHSMDDGLKSMAIWSLLPDVDGTLWVGTFRGGLLRFKDGRFTRYTQSSGLPSDVICQILDDGLGKLWIGSHKGIFNVQKKSFKDFDAGMIPTLSCTAYGLYDGLPTLECSGNYQPSCWRGRDGMLWFATVKGLVSIRPTSLTVNRLPPPVMIETVLVDGKPFGKESRDLGKSETTVLGFPLAASLEIPPGKHQVDFHYTALSFAAPDKVRFRYRLEGLDEGWVEADGKRSAHYGPLQPGDYCFHVSACNNDGVWNDAGASLHFKVLPHFWETWLFDFLMMGMLVAAIFCAVRFVITRNLRRKLERLKHQTAIERERERIARDIHDDLGAGLTQIMLQSALARRATQDQSPAHLAQISDTARELVGAMDEIVWAIDPENDTLEGLINYAGKFFQEYASLAGLRCRLDLPAQAPSYVLSAEVRHNVFLAVKEALNNVIKHAAATEVSLQLKTLPSGFSFVIKDDGRGFLQGEGRLPTADADRISSGHGLRNLASRLEGVGGTCMIRSEPGRGTMVELTIMLQNRGGFQAIRQKFLK